MPTCSCAVVGCFNNTKHIRKWKQEMCETHTSLNGQGQCSCSPPFHLHCFPACDLEKRKNWIKAVNRIDAKTGKNWEPNKYDRICSVHFENGASMPTLLLGHTYFTPGKPRRDRTVPTSVTSTLPVTPSPKMQWRSAPSISPGIYSLELPSTTDEMMVDEIRHGDADVDLEPQEVDVEPHDSEVEVEVEPHDTEVEVDVEAHDEEIEMPSIQPISTMCDKLLTSDKKVRFYTGLPNREVFQLVLEMVKPEAERLRYWKGTKKASKIFTKLKGHVRTPKKTGPRRKLTLEDEFLLTLMKLRLGALNEDLADRFGVSNGLISMVFNTWIKALSILLKALVDYPPKECIQANLPECYQRDFPRLRCIIDCTEIFIERPRDLELQTLTWSDYKKHNTAKVLVGITPRGRISFISKAWGGRTSDQHIVLNSGFLNLLDPNDQIMADKGFVMREDFMIRGAQLIIPPGAKGREQMTAADVCKTKKVANLRIHVERAIGRLKCYRLLNGTLPISLVPLIDDILIVCSALINLRDNLVT